MYYKQNETDRQPASQLKSYKFTSNASKCKNIRQLIKIETFYLCVFNVLIFDFWRDVCLIVSERTTKTETHSIFSKLSALRCATRATYLSCMPELVWAWMRIRAIRKFMTQNQQNTHIDRERETAQAHINFVETKTRFIFRWRFFSSEILLSDKEIQCIQIHTFNMLWWWRWSNQTAKHIEK